MIEWANINYKIKIKIKEMDTMTIPDLSKKKIPIKIY